MEAGPWCHGVRSRPPPGIRSDRLRVHGPPALGTGRPGSQAHDFGLTSRPGRCEGRVGRAEMALHPGTARSGSYQGQFSVLWSPEGWCRSGRHPHSTSTAPPSTIWARWERRISPTDMEKGDISTNSSSIPFQGVRTSRRIFLYLHALETKTVVPPKSQWPLAEGGDVRSSPGPGEGLAQCFWLVLEDEARRGRQEGECVVSLLCNRPLACVFFSV